MQRPASYQSIVYRRRRAPRRRHACRQGGQVLVTVAVSLTVLFGFAALVVDVGLLRVSHGQLRAAADGAALAAAATLRHRNLPAARRRARQVAAANRALADRMRPISAAATSVRRRGPQRIEVTLSRRPGTGGGVRSYFAPLLGLGREGSVQASATAQTFELCGAAGFRPLAIPDRWRDLDQDGVYDPGEPYDPTTTGYRPQRDEGLLLRVAPYVQGGGVPPGMQSYLAVRLPAVDGGQGAPRRGAGSYRRFLGQGAPFTVRAGESLALETAGVGSATRRVLTRLLRLDPSARWDARQFAVIGRTRGLSPRVLALLLVDPATLPSEPPGPPRNLRITRLAAALLERVESDGTLVLRLVPLASEGDDCPGRRLSFLYRTSLVE